MKKILLLDEEISLAKELREGVMLRKPDTMFHNAYTYKEAFNLVQKNDYDVIVIDVVIPIGQEDYEINNKLVDEYSTGIVFKDHIIEKGFDKAELFLFTSRSNLSESDKNGIAGVIEKPKRPSQIVKQIFKE